MNQLFEDPMALAQAHQRASKAPEEILRDAARRSGVVNKLPPFVTSDAINVNILALDLGTKMGYAVKPREGRIVHGTQIFTPRSSWTPGQKWQRVRSWLSETIAAHNVGRIVFEDVRRHAQGAVLAAHAYGGYRAMMEMVADQHGVELVTVGVGAIKKHWTGKGNATKPDMIKEAKRRGYRPDTDNAADALAILDWAVAQERAL